MNMKRPEILAPAGNMMCLKAAIAAGCDAIYLGGSFYGARAFSNNFTNEEIIEAVTLAHKYGVKIYVTVNTIIYEHEVKNFMKYIEFLYMNNVDAVIVQDIGMMDLIRQTYPDLDVHASTQMHIHTLEGVKFVEDLGLTRAVLARETTIDDIENIKKNTNIELEIFVHGALCISYSGQCLMSSIIGGRSGNRGTCAQPCRQKYNVLDSDKKKVNNYEYNLSTKDLNSLDNIGKLIEIGVDSLKIEGRMKSPSYVYLVVSLYKKAIDCYLENKKVKIDDEDIKKLMVTFNRLYTKGFMFYEKNNDFINPVRPNHQGIEIGKITRSKNGFITIKLTEKLSINDGIRIVDKEDTGFIVTNMYKGSSSIKSANAGDTISIKTPYNIKENLVVLKTLDYELNKTIESLINKNERYVFINGRITIKENEVMTLEVSDNIHTIKVSSDNKITKAINNPSTSDMVLKQLNKTGDTVYKFLSIETDYNEKLFVPIKELNELRRIALLKLDEERLKLNRSYKEGKYKRKVKEYPRSYNKNIYIEDEDAFLNTDLSKYNMVYVDEDVFNKYKDKYSNIYLKLPRVKPIYKDYDTHMLVSELGSVYKYKDIDTDFSLNIVNSYSVALLHSMGVNKVTLSYELNERQIAKLINCYNTRYHKHPNLEMIIFGREELMVSKFNVLNYYSLKNEGYLEDRFKNLYPIKEHNGLMYIYNNKVRYNKDLDLYHELGINNFRYNIVKKEDLKLF